MGRLVVLSNCVSLNGGDAAIVEATMATLRRTLGDDTHFVIHDRDHEAVRSVWPAATVRPWPWQLFAAGPRPTLAGKVRRRLAVARAQAAAALLGRGWRAPARLLVRGEARELLEEYARADLVVSKGGTYLVESYNLEPHFFDYRLTRLLRRPLVLYTQSLGPFADAANQRRMRELAGEALVLLRDERSAEHLRDIGVADGFEVYADAAFTLADPEVLARAAQAGAPDGPLRVAVSVREWRHFRTVSPEEGMARYEGAMRALVERLVRVHGAEVTFLSTCQGHPAYFTDDSRTAHRIAATLAEDVRGAVTVDDAWHTTAQLRERLAGFDVAVGTRMHFAILSLGCGTPVFPIAYEFKTAELFRRLGLAAWVQDIETIDPAEAGAALDDFLARLPELRPGLFAAVERQRAWAEEAGDRAAALVGGARPAPEPRPDPVTA